jgi:hypothetical protein
LLVLALHSNWDLSTHGWAHLPAEGHFHTITPTSV